MPASPLRRLIFALLSFAVALAAPQLAHAQATHRSAASTLRRTVTAIDSADLRARLYLFADDSMLGREAGELGNVKATDYLAREAKRLGLRPAGEKGTYFQSVPLVRRSLDSASALAVAASRFTFGRDFVFLPYVAPHPFDSAQVIFGGALGDTSVALRPEETAGKLLLLLPGPLSSTPALLAAKAVAIVGAPAFTAQEIAASRQPTDFLPGWSPSGVLPDFFSVTPAMAAQILGADPRTAAPRATGRIVREQLRYHDASPRYPARNVVAIVRGRDPKLAAEYVALGAHNDHIGIRHEGPLDHDSAWLANRMPQGTGPNVPPASALDSLRRVTSDRPDSIYNGADDDGSGSMALLEIAEYFARSGVRPKRSILFVWHTAEEKGLFGSLWYGEHPTVPRDSIVADIDVDMIGRGSATDAPGGGPHYLMTVGSRRLSTELGDILDSVNAKETQPFAIDLQYDAPGHPAQLYCRSDHVSYARWGIPAVAMSTGLEPDYHQVTDEPQEIDYAHFAAVTRFMADLALAVGNLDHRPRVDHPKPDPNAPCQQ